MSIFKVVLGVFSHMLLGFFLFLLFGFLSAIQTRLSIDFKATYGSGEEEVLNVEFNTAKGQVTYLFYDKDDKPYAVRQLNGWFLKWGNYYIFPSMVTHSPLSSRYFNIKTYYIKEAGKGKYLLLNHQRGLHIVNDKEIFPLKRVFTSEVLGEQL